MAKLITEQDRELIRAGWAAGLNRAHFGGGRGVCQATGGKDGSVVLYIARDKAQLEDDYKSGTPFLLSVGAYKRLKAEMDALHPQAAPKPKAKPTGKIILRDKAPAPAETQSQ